jgi:hypothetical protein
MKYSLSCPAPCNHAMNVEAQNDDEGVAKLLEAGKVHAKQAHPDMPPMTDEQMRGMVRSAMRKG